MPRADKTTTLRTKLHRFRLRPRAWSIAGAALLVGVGSLAAVFASLAVTHDARAESHKAFAQSAVEIAATFELAIQHENDLVVSTETYMLEHPRGSEAAFLQWAATMHAMARYPEVLGFGEVKFVPAAQLPTFAAEVSTRPASTTPDHPFSVIPPGPRAFYCLSSFGVARPSDAPEPEGLDYCATSFGPFLLRAASTSDAELAPLALGRETAFSLGVPVYRDGLTPSTPAARRAALIGWVGLTVNPGILFRTALEGHPGAAAALVFDDASAGARFSSGAAGAGARTITIGLNPDWRVAVSEFQPSGLLSADGLAVLLGGIAVSVLLGVVILLLGTGRSRAVAMVAERTDQLEFQALHDSLTGLPNRSLILDRIEQMIARGRRNHQPAAVMFVDLDDFKDINDTLGHHAGDAILVAVAARLVAVVRASDTVGRLGGDEFVLLIEGDEATGGYAAAAGRVLEALRRPFEVVESELPLAVAASIGIAIDGGQSAGELLRDADIAMYQAKAAGKQRAAVFVPAMQAAVELRRNLTLDLHEALETAQFFLLYQPTIDLETSAITGVEALLRWRHPERGVIMPDEFIPALEASGLIVPVGAWVLASACRQAATWRAKGHDLTMSVNVSARQLEGDRVIDDVRAAIAESGFDPGGLILELTESSLMRDADQTVACLERLKALDVRIAIDDFGTGYSSLSYLRQFPIDVLKIDRSFVSAMTNSVEGAAIVHTLVQLGKILELETVAEGIEDDEQRRCLLAESVDIGQGFLFSRPIEAKAVDQLLAAGQGRPAAGVRETQPLGV